MKKYLILLLALPLLLCCSSDEVRNNPYLPSYNFDYPIDMTLPIYNDLRNPSNPVVVNVAGVGINGVIVMNTGSGYVAFENTCPNQEITNCSILEINGILAKCPCDGVEYSLYDGGPTTPARFGLKVYRVQVLNNTNIRIYN